MEQPRASYDTSVTTASWPGAVEVHAQRHLVAAGRVDVVHLRGVRLAQPGVVRPLGVLEDDLLVEVHQTATPKTAGTRSSAASSAATSSSVLYAAKLARVVAVARNRRCSGQAQWCPTRTAMPASSRTCPTSWAWTPSTTKETAPPRSSAADRPEHADPRTLRQAGEQRLGQRVLVGGDPVHARGRRGSRTAAASADGLGGHGHAGLEALRAAPRRSSPPSGPARSSSRR